MIGMKQKSLVAFAAVMVIIAIMQVPCYPANCYSVSYYLLESFNSPKQYKLNVAVPFLLYDYYKEMDHRQVSIEDFAKFVTPYPLTTIADKLWEIYKTPEDFANGVLMIVHQIPYSVTLPAKYPIETIVENAGDCDLLSYVAASIMKAGGLDIVLLYYPNEAHMNVGVHLPTPPRYARTSVYYVIYGGRRYYMAECTGDNWMDGWRVGECPRDLLGAECQIIPLEGLEERIPQLQVSASYKSLLPSTISLTVSPNFGVQLSSFTISGQLLPKMQNKSITIYFKVGNSPWNVLATTQTDSEGRFSYDWVPRETGIYLLRASWSGDDDYSCADSPTVAITVISTFLLLIFVATAVLVCFGVAIFLTSSQSSYMAEEPILPRDMR
ncbi:MAG: Ig-like domain-containing protein [Candidatus Bathyarchaeia archaeon]